MYYVCIVDRIQVDSGCTTELTHSGYHFLQTLFEKYDKVSNVFGVRIEIEYCYCQWFSNIQIHKRDNLYAAIVHMLLLSMILHNIWVSIHTVGRYKLCGYFNRIKTVVCHLQSYRNCFQLARFYRGVMMF